MPKHSDHGGHHHLRSRDLQLPNEPDLLNVIQIFQALSDLTRAKVIFALTQGERSVNEIAVIAGASPSSVSHHLRRLRDAGLGGIPSAWQSDFLFYRGRAHRGDS